MAGAISKTPVYFVDVARSQKKQSQSSPLQFIEETISVRTGGTVPTAHCRSVPSSKNDSRMWKYLCIEEPFDLTNTARSVYDEEVFKRVRKVFLDSYKLLDEKRDLSAILGDRYPVKSPPR
ncbi:Poly(A) RNA polymerase gld-2 A [Portunus trituberculatus]|uniref:Poly(A) RNA polymerase gld-2 A n=1 Tax=Portunus trituberculatus TaxID=210409 RepID=A0A5B7FQS3_PORTR|nr:Poly(A) RNA polymerase gld-2 A [Portunus trituberculatus]